ncbi:MAG: 5-bromo-4-chloroindolyl phosphate hydrolysis family protein [Clostridiales bacterium]|nr:5-bromo-4-chloroindolyl phosphate hydrolysis family protein [Candidatus Apopatocola equi]
MANTPFDPFGDRRESNDDLGDLAQNILRELKNTTDLVGDAVRVSKDELLRSVEQGIRTARTAAREAQKSSSQNRYRYSEEFRSAEADFAAQRQQRRTESARRTQEQNRLRPVSKGAGFLLIPASLFLVPAAILFLVAAFLAGDESVAMSIIAGSFSVVGAIPLGIFAGKKRREKLYTRFLRTVGQRPGVNLRFLSAQMKRSYDKTVSDLRDMVARGYFGPAARVDVGAGELIIDEAALNAEKAQQERQAQEKAAQGNNAEGYEAMLTELQQLNVLIEDESMSEMITRIETVARATFLAVRQAPEKASSLRRFMDYYLPTTIELLRSYASFERSTVGGENIRRSMENIEGMMKTLCEAFEKQYDSLFLSETLDINAEIRTMDSLLRQDGLAGSAGFGAAAAAQEKKE